MERKRSVKTSIAEQKATDYDGTLQPILDHGHIVSSELTPEAAEAIAKNMGNGEIKAVSSVIVCDSHGHPHRTYSLDVHGENFRALAEQYVSVRPGWSLK